MDNSVAVCAPEKPRTCTPYYPVFLDVRGRFTVVVGGGSVAERKVDGLLKAVHAYALCLRDVTAGLEVRVNEGSVTLERRLYGEGDLKGAFLVYAATDDAAINEAVYAEAEARGVLANVADDPQHCNLSCRPLLDADHCSLPYLLAALRRCWRSVCDASWKSVIRMIGRYTRIYCLKCECSFAIVSRGAKPSALPCSRRHVIWGCSVVFAPARFLMRNRFTSKLSMPPTSRA